MNIGKNRFHGNQYLEFFLDIEEKKIINLPDSKVTLAQIGNLEKLCFGEEAWNEKMLESHFQFQKGLFLEDEKGENIAYILHLDLGTEAEILRIGVNPNFQKKGVGKLLLNTLKNSYQKITLEVKENNIPAISLYESTGFKKLAMRKNYYPGNISAILYMFEKSLT